MYENQKLAMALNEFAHETSVKMASKHKGNLTTVIKVHDPIEGITHEFEVRVVGHTKHEVDAPCRLDMSSQCHGCGDCCGN